MLEKNGKVYAVEKKILRYILEDADRKPRAGDTLESIENEFTSALTMMAPSIDTDFEHHHFSKLYQGIWCDIWTCITVTFIGKQYILYFCFLSARYL